MFKLLTFLVLGYFAYQYFIKPVLPKGAETNQPPIKDQSTKEDKKHGDYIDYEEVD